MCALLPAKIVRIGEDAFRGCQHMFSVELPRALTTVESGAFAGCTDLMTLIVYNKLTSICENAFAGCTSRLCVFTASGIAPFEHNLFSDSEEAVVVVTPDADLSLWNKEMVYEVDNWEKKYHKLNRSRFSLKGFFKGIFKRKGIKQKR